MDGVRTDRLATQGRTLVLSTLRGAGLGTLGGAVGGVVALVVLMVPEAVLSDEGSPGALALVLLVYGTLAALVGAGIGAGCGGMVGTILGALRLTGAPRGVVVWAGPALAAAAVVTLVPPKLFTGFSTVLPPRVDSLLQLLVAWGVPIVLGGYLSHRHGRWVAEQPR